MKPFIKTLLPLAVVIGLNLSVNAQEVLTPQPSSAQTIIQDFGLGKITVNYSRPSAKGRKIFGALEPFDKVWRTGANFATTLVFTDAVKIEGKEVSAGEYGLFTIPSKNEWTIILSKAAKQWGAYTYNEKDDVLRVKVKPVALQNKVETFTMQFANVLPTAAQLQLSWENTLVPINLTTDIDAKVMARIDAAMKGEKKPYFQAAHYYLENGKDLNKALEWFSEAEKGAQDAPYIKLWKGKTQLKMGDKKGAQASAQAGLDVAKKTNNEEYVRLCSQLLADSKK
ncbi:MAG: DUF2911 domain-containing protein [Pedobacter sp.]|nr:MAG: DUF2911 domain-containing protein [Pedobacter sp.]